MKKHIILFVLLILLVSLSACAASSLSKDIIGTWTCQTGSAEVVLTLKNSRFTMTFSNEIVSPLSETITGDYTIDKDAQKILLTADEDPQSNELVIKCTYVNGNLRLVAEDLDDMVFVK